MQRKYTFPLLATALLATACAPVFDAPKSVTITPVETPMAPVLHADEEYYQGAVKAVGNRDYALALDYLQAARNAEAKDVRVFNAFGVVYDKLGRFDLSARYYSEARAADPTSQIVAWNLSYSQKLQGLAGHAPATAVAAVAPAAHATTPAPAPGADGAKPVEELNQPPTAAPTIRVASAALADPVRENIPAKPAVADAAQAAPAAAPAAPAPAPVLAAPPAPRIVLADVAVPAVTPSLLSLPHPDFSLSRPARFLPQQVVFRLHPVARPAWQMVARVGSKVAAGQREDDQHPITSMTTSVTSRITARVLSRVVKPILTGHPLELVDATGRDGAADGMRTRLSHLGWTIPLRPLRDDPETSMSLIYYPKNFRPAAEALARTLSWPVKLSARACDCGLTLVIGKDFPASVAATKPEKPKGLYHVAAKA